MKFKPGDLVIDVVTNKKAAVIGSYQDGDMHAYWIRYIDGGDFNSVDVEELAAA